MGKIGFSPYSLETADPSKRQKQTFTVNLEAKSFEDDDL
jgi:hypothetical protein